MSKYRHNYPIFLFVTQLNKIKTERNEYSFNNTGTV